MDGKLIVNVFFYNSETGSARNEIHKLCERLTKGIDIRKYTSSLDVVNITLTVSVRNETKRRRKSQNILISTDYRTANISLQISEEYYCSLWEHEKKKIILENVLNAMKYIKDKLKDNFDYQKLEEAVVGIWHEELVSIK